VIGTVLFDWGDTVMRDYGTPGPMADWPQVSAIDGVAGALEATAARHRVALATNSVDSDEALVRRALARVGLDRYFERIFVSSVIGAEKPSPAFFQAVLGGLDCRPDEVVMVGDSYEKDVHGAAASGLWTIWYDPDGVPAPPGAHDHYAQISAMNSLPFVLNRLEMWIERLGRHQHTP
jgi:HAD superfamily hydrolase (TIGR01509 family)